MEKSYFTERQIIGFLNKQEAGKSVSNLCREHIFSQPILYQLKTKYGGKDVGQLKWLNELESELVHHKRIVAEQTLQIVVLKDVVEKKL